MVEVQTLRGLTVCRVTGVTRFPRRNFIAFRDDDQCPKPESTFGKQCPHK